MRRLFLKDLFLAFFVLLIIAMLVVPLPTLLLDVLLCVNLAFSLLLLLVGLYLSDALSLLSFPSILLLSTLFRLSLNVASTRLILSSGNAGQVIEAFGTFMIRGEVVVGVIIFIVITIVNFVVIARGSARVSEVAARFALDALPGRQLSIDADVRAGVLTLEEARNKREDLRRESQLYGAMDGAMKFIQGDAIAGLFIIVVNVVGGLYMGVQQGMDIADALQTYTRLTIGDGLVSQIPAILTSVCAGVVVTRISSNKSATLAADVSTQLLSRPILIILTGSLISLLAFLPGIPILVFLGIGLSIITSGLWLSFVQTGLRDQFFRKGVSAIASQLPAPEEGAIELSAVTLFLDKKSLFEIYELSAAEHKRWWNGFQTDFYSQLGLSIPGLRVSSEVGKEPGAYRISIDGIKMGAGTIPKKAIIIETNPLHITALGLELVANDVHPLNGAEVSWIRDSPVSREVLTAARIRHWNFFQWSCLKIAVFLNRHPEEVLSMADVHALLKGVEKRLPGFFADAVDKSLVDLPVLTHLLHGAVKCNIGARDFKSILEVFATYCSLKRITQIDDIDSEELLTLLRVKRRRQLLRMVLGSRQTIKVITLGMATQEIFSEMLPSEGDGAPVVHPDKMEGLLNSFDLLLEPMRTKGVLPVSILCPSDLRGRVERTVRSFNFIEPVLSFDELDSLIKVEPVGVW
jgi:type III secretion protein V